MKQPYLKELKEKYKDRSEICLQDCHNEMDELIGLVADIMDRYTMDVILASVPDDRNKPHTTPQPGCEGWDIGFNECRKRTLTKAREITNQ